MQFKHIRYILCSSLNSSKIFAKCGQFWILTIFSTPWHIIQWQWSALLGDFRFLILCRPCNNNTSFWKHRGHHFKVLSFSFTYKYIYFNDEISLNKLLFLTSLASTLSSPNKLMNTFWHVSIFMGFIILFALQQKHWPLSSSIFFKLLWVYETFKTGEQQIKRERVTTLAPLFDLSPQISNFYRFKSKEVILSACIENNKTHCIINLKIFFITPILNN